jgi:hypothetical protein
MLTTIMLKTRLNNIMAGNIEYELLLNNHYTKL